MARPDPDGKRKHVVRKGLAVDNIVSNTFWDNQKPVLSEDGLRFAWKAKPAGQVVVEVDHNEVHVGEKTLKGPTIDKDRHSKSEGESGIC